jgi:hypothetical protein
VFELLLSLFAFLALAVVLVDHDLVVVVVHFVIDAGFQVFRFLAVNLINFLFLLLFRVDD